MMNAKTDRLMAGTVILVSFGTGLLSAQPYHFAGGTGEPDDPYQIATAEQLISIGSDPNLLDKHFILLNDIDLDPNLPDGQVFKKALIAPSEDRYYLRGTPFTGTFSGRGHSIRNLTFERPTLMDARDLIGLFGNVGKGGLVCDLSVEDANLKQQGGSSYSPLAAWNEGRIVRCGATGKVVGNGDTGMVAAFNRGEIIDCWAEGEVSGRSDIGGLVGTNHEPPWSGVAFYKGLLEVAGEVHDSYFLIDTDGGGPDNGFGVALTGIQMKQQASFVDWDFDKTWTICEGKDYPRLRWEDVPCEK
jgi:hypothetical protein